MKRALASLAAVLMTSAVAFAQDTPAVSAEAETILGYLSICDDYTYEEDCVGAIQRAVRESAELAAEDQAAIYSKIRTYRAKARFISEQIDAAFEAAGIPLEEPEMGEEMAGDAMGGDVVAAVSSYTIEQAEAGEDAYQEHCAVCHGGSAFGEGESPSLRGDFFANRWFGENPHSFVNYITGAMPQQAPGSLSPEEYAVITAFLMQLNGVPAGDIELPSDLAALEAIQLPPRN